MGLGVQNTAVSTVLDKTTPVTMLLGPVMSAVSLDIGETHVYSHSAIHVGGPLKTCYQNGGGCVICPPGYYGDKCVKPCRCGRSDQACDRYTGDCQSCPPGFKGAKCDQSK